MHREPHLVTLNFSTHLHVHQNNVVVFIERTGSTSDGFEMRNGGESQQLNMNSMVGRFQFHDNWVNPETGQKFRVSGTGVGVFEDGPPPADPTEVRVENFTIRCVGGPTLLP